MNNNQRWNKCPVCGSTKISIRFYFEYTKSLLYGSIPITLKNLPELWKCDKCSSAFVQNIISEKDSIMLYKNSNSKQRWPIDNFQTSRPNKVIEEIKTLLNPNDHVLDIGASSGEFLDFAKSRGCDTVAVELSLLSKKILKQKGHKYFSSIDKVTGKFNYIFALDLVEHLYDIQGFFSFCKDHLLPGGKLIILMGDINSTTATFEQELWSYILYPEHVVFPSLDGLKQIKGFQIKKVIPTKNSQEPIKKYYWAFGKIVKQKKLIYFLDILNDHNLIVMGVKK